MEKLKQPHTAVIDRFTTQHNSITRLWNVDTETAELLTMIALIKKPKIILELGTSNGFSTFHFAISEVAKIISIDVEPSRQKLAQENLKYFKNIVFINEKIEDYIPKIDYEIDMLFIDANKPNYVHYIHAIEPMLANEALVIADNIDSHNTTEKYCEYVRNSPYYTTIHLSIDDGLLISIYKGEHNEKRKSNPKKH